MNLIQYLVKYQAQDFRQWFKEKSNIEDRMNSLWLGLWSGIIIGVIAIFIFEVSQINYWYWFAGTLALAIVSFMFPKYSRILLSPFNLFAWG